MSVSSLVPCPVCRESLELRVANGRKSGKAFLMLVCNRDGRHFRGFITDKNYVYRVHTRLKDLQPKDSSK